MRFLLLALLGAGALQVAQAKGDAAACKVQLRAWDQCGGKSNCKGRKCVGQWENHCCPLGFQCVRNDDYYYNCQGQMNWSGNNNNNNNNNNQQQQQNNNNNNQPQQNQWQPQGPVVKKLERSPVVKARKLGNGDYDYGQVLGLSFQFYEAQRSGKLPKNNRIKWRGDSGLTDRLGSRDVTGGWYDAGDNVKFNLPMAWTAGVLAWSVYEFKDGYKAAKQLDTALDNIKWVTDYFIKCVGDGTEIVGQVGNGASDHGVWGRPEDKSQPNPVYTLTPQRPGSDVVGAMAAALGAASVIFKDSNPGYSAQLLSAALKAFDFATKYQGLYNNAIPDAANFYRSSNMYDDMAWAAVWLAIRTGDVKFKTAAKELYDKHWKTEDGKGVWNNYDWDSNSWGVVVMLSRWFPEDPFFKTRMEGFIQDWTKGGPWVKHTPKGLAFSGEWGSLRHVGNALFLMEAYANGLPADKSLRAQVDCFAHGQMNYILGGVTGHSFVVGYGPNPPQQPHHRGASCPPLGQECTWDYFNSKEPNPHTLYGALVGGPNANDAYDDNRNNFIQNEVATDYNGGFTGALAGLVKPWATAAQCGLKL